MILCWKKIIILEGYIYKNHCIPNPDQLGNGSFPILGKQSSMCDNKAGKNFLELSSLPRLLEQGILVVFCHLGSRSLSNLIWCQSAGLDKCCTGEVLRSVIFCC